MRDEFESVNSTHLVSLENVRVTLGGTAVLSGISWILQQGDLWTVAGPNGAGKSTFLKLLKGDLWPDPVLGGRRRYNFDGDPQEAPADLKARIAWVAPEQQERYWRQGWDLPAGDVIESGFFQTDYLEHRLTKAQRRTALGISEVLSVAHLRRRNVQTLSQGELRRILIARALVSKPKLLLLDEVTHGLDEASRKSLFRVLEGVVKDGTTVVFTTHRPDERISGHSRCLWLKAGKIVDGGAGDGPPDSNSNRRGSTRKNPMNGQHGFPIGQPNSEMLGERFKLPRKSAAGRKGSRRENRPLPASQSTALVSLRGVNVYLNRNRVVRNVHWTVRRGEQWAVLGANGSGKSTLIKTLVGDLHPAWGGGVTRFHTETRPTLWEVRARVGYLAADFQSAYEWDRTAREVVISGFFASVGLMDRPTGMQQTVVERVLSEFHLEPLADRVFDQLSYGQRRRILLARAVVHGPQLLALDEPFDGLDAAARQEWIDTLGRLAQRETTLVLATHHEEDVPEWFTHTLRMQDGRVVYRGPRSGA